YCVRKIRTGMGYAVSIEACPTPQPLEPSGFRRMWSSSPAPSVFGIVMGHCARTSPGCACPGSARASSRWRRASIRATSRRAISLSVNREKCGILNRPPQSAAGGIAGRFAIRLGLPTPVAVSVDRDDVRMVHDAVDQRGDGRGVGEDAGPFAERQVGGEGETPSLVAATDDLEEQIGGAGVVGQIPDFIDQEQSLLTVVLQPPP